MRWRGVLLIFRPVELDSQWAVISPPGVLRGKDTVGMWLVSQDTWCPEVINNIPNNNSLFKFTSLREIQSFKPVYIPIKSISFN